MLFVRPVKVSDHKEILALAKEAGIGMTSLPANAGVLEEKIERSVKSFSGHKDTKGCESFLFVLEDSDKKKLVGTTGIAAHVGLHHPFYSYKLSTIVQASSEVDVYSRQRVLHMVNDYTGASEVGSLFLKKDYRRDGIGRFLSRCRYLMFAQFPALFSDVVISEIRGVQDADGESPFYKHLARDFFQMDFKKADFVNATTGTQFISDLMPKYPIYVNLLHPDAQAVIGQPLEASKAAKHMLEKEGFRHQGYVDVFDAGPTMQAERGDIRTVRESRSLPVAEVRAVKGKTKYLIGNATLADFRVTFTVAEEAGSGMAIDAETAKILGVKKGDQLRSIEA